MLVPRGKRRPDLGVGEAIIAMIRCGRGALMNQRTRAINQLPGGDLGRGSWAGTSSALDVPIGDSTSSRDWLRITHELDAHRGDGVDVANSLVVGTTPPGSGRRPPERRCRLLRHSCVGPGRRRGSACNMNCVPWQGVVIYGP